MYTQCPDCQTAFRVTAQVLQQASGRVRCGGCGNAFNAILSLSEEKPSRKPAGKGPAGAKPQQTGSTPAQDARSKALLEALDALAGNEDVRIEDTGIEWRVLDDDGNEVDDGDNNNADDHIRYQDSGIVQQLPGDDSNRENEALTSSSATRTQATPKQVEAELRYDDNTPLPEDIDEENSGDYRQQAPSRRETDQPAFDPDVAARQIDLDIGGPEDWATLLEDNEGKSSGATGSGLSSQNNARGANKTLESSTHESLPELAADPADDDDDDDDNYRADISDTAGFAIEVEEELAAIHSELTASVAALSPGAATDTDDDDPNASSTNIVLDADSFPEPFMDEETGELLLIAEEDAETPEVFDDEPDTRIWVDADDDDDTVITDPDGAENSPPAAAGDAPLQLAGDEDSDDDFDDELSAAEEANIVVKLRESTGAFQKQIEAAQRALESGDIALYNESMEQAAEVTSGDPDLSDESTTDNETDHKTDMSANEQQDADDAVADFHRALSFDEDRETPEPVEDIEDAEEMSIAEDDDEEPTDLLSQTMIRAGIDPSLLDHSNIETIIMEGEFVRGALEDAQENLEQDRVAAFEEPDSLIDTYILNKGKSGRRTGDRPGAGMIFSVVLLALILGAQYLHMSRDTLATYGSFNQTLGPLYRALGRPVTPQWNVKGWRFESTRGSTDDNGQLLTIFSNVSNGSGQALPYPLVHVSLTDRWEEIIGSKVLEPGEYLAGDLDPRIPVAPGDRFSAVIAIESPSPDATGFKLNVCYRVAPGKVRCATEDFKN